MIARYGGDEFVPPLPDTDEESAPRMIAKRVLRSVRKQNARGISIDAAWGASSGPEIR